MMWMKTQKVHILANFWFNFACTLVLPMNTGNTPTDEALATPTTVEETVESDHEGEFFLHHTLLDFRFY